MKSEKSMLSIETIREYWRKIEVKENPEGALADIYLLCDEVERLEEASLILLREANKLLRDTKKLENSLKERVRREAQ